MLDEIWKWGSLVFICILLHSPSAFADDLEDGEAAFAHGDYKTAGQLLKPYADNGDPLARWIIDVIKNMPTHQVGPADQALVNFYKEAPRILAQINALPNAEQREGVMQAFRRDRERLEEAAAAEERARGLPQASATSLRAMNGERDITLYDLQQKQKEMEQRQIEMQSEMHTNENFDAMQESIDRTEINETQDSLWDLRYNRR
jgi:hypothetical protein